MVHYASFMTKVLGDGLQVTFLIRICLTTKRIYEIIGRSCFIEKFVENECTIEENGPDYVSVMDDARSKVNHNAEEMTPLRQNIFDRSKTSWFHIVQEKN